MLPLLQLVHRHFRPLDRRAGEAEARLEGLRSQHYAAGDALNAAQGELYAASAEVSRVENRLASLRESRQRLDHELAQLESQLAQQAGQLAAAERDLARWRDERGRAELLRQSAAFMERYRVRSDGGAARRAAEAIVRLASGRDGAANVS